MYVACAIHLGNKFRRRQKHRNGLNQTKLVVLGNVENRQRKKSILTSSAVTFFFHEMQFQHQI